MGERCAGPVGSHLSPLLLAILLALGGCGTSVDPDRARVCRMVLPALNAEGAIRILHVGPAPRGDGLRVDYEVARPDRAPLIRHVVCRFAPDGGSARRADLLGLSTERETVGGASLYLLKRYYLDTPEAVMADSGALSPGTGLAELSPPVAAALQALVVGLPRTTLYALLAAAYALVFGLCGRLNLAFGEIAAVGAAATATAVALAWTGGGEPMVGLAFGTACAVGTAALHNLVGGHLAIAAIPPERRQASLIATVGLSLALMEGLRLVEVPGTRWAAPVGGTPLPLARAGDFVVTTTPMTLLVAGVALVAAAALLALMARSPYGRAWRACADDRGAAALCGIDPARLLRHTLALSGGLAGLSGALMVAQWGGLGFAGGFQFGLKALIAAVLGGVGSVPGALLGGLGLGLFETAWSHFMPIDGRDAALYAVLAVVLMLRPGGLLGFGQATPRPV